MDVKDMIEKNIKNANVDDIKKQASKAIDEVANNKEVKSKINSAIDAVEKKVKVDIPDVDGIKKLLD
ncbi:MAG: hypothetical protein MJ172_10805 [Clostridia bacterium]|nr:hypothetical protein [Clostridia bacterium]